MFFDLVGKGTTFYSWLDVPSSASMAEIGRAYRKKSMLLQCVSTFRLLLPSSYAPAACIL